jgi:hypothetical protein
MTRRRNVPPRTQDEKRPRPYISVNHNETLVRR